VPKNPENLEAPNKSELKPRPQPNVAKGIGGTAIKGSSKARRAVQSGD
jgi:hypothetical protein